MKKKTKKKPVEADLPITRIVYSRLKNLGDYENKRIEAEITVPAGGCAEAALTQLQTWVDDKLDIIEF